MLKPKLINVKMMMCNGDRSNRVMEYRETPVELWKSVGLCVHYLSNEWRISHFFSGRVILGMLENRDQAIDYMMKLHEIHNDWTLTDSQLRGEKLKDKIIPKRDKLQKEILYRRG
jgi:hypothetical protein